MKAGDTYSYNYTVTEKVYNGFREIFSDNNPLHTNHEFAVAKGMKGVVMHGNILNGFISHFIGEVLPEKNVIIHSQNISFYKPVYLGDEVILSAELAEVHEAVKSFTFKFIFRNTLGERLAKGSIQIGLI